MPITLVSIPVLPDFSGEGSSAVHTFLQGSCSAQYSEQYHPWDQLMHKSKSLLLLLRELYHCLKASDSSSMSHVLPDCRAASPKTPRFAAFKSVERSSDRSTEISLIVLCIGLTNRFPAVRLCNLFRQCSDDRDGHPINAASNNAALIDRIADIVDDDSGFAVVAGVLCLFECHWFVLTFLISSYQPGTLLSYSAIAEMSSVFENSLKGGVYER